MFYIHSKSDHTSLISADIIDGFLAMIKRLPHLAASSPPKVRVKMNVIRYVSLLHGQGQSDNK